MTSGPPTVASHDSPTHAGGSGAGKVLARLAAPGGCVLAGGNQTARARQPTLAAGETTLGTVTFADLAGSLTIGRPVPFGQLEAHEVQRCRPDDDRVVAHVALHDSPPHITGHG